MAIQHNRILTFSCTHFPFAHPDCFDFLQAVKNKYKPTAVVHCGDEIDQHGISFHDHNPDLPSHGDELIYAIEDMQKLYKIFNNVPVYVLDSNHGSLLYRKAIHYGISSRCIKNNNELLKAPPNWSWQPELILETSNCNILFRHNLKKNVLQNAHVTGCSFVQGHYHSEFKLEYSPSAKHLWGMIVGCLIDDKALAFQYNKVHLNRPKLGCSMIIDGVPTLIPLLLDKEMRWVGRSS